MKLPRLPKPVVAAVTTSATVVIAKFTDEWMKRYERRREERREREGS